MQHDTPPVVEPDKPRTRRLRFTPTAFVPLLIAALCAIPLAAALGLWGLLLAVPFIVLGIWLRRVGMDIGAEEVRVHGALSSVRIPRSELVGFTADKKHVHLVRGDGSTVRIPTVRPRDLPMLRQELFPRDAAQGAGPAT